jgi:hypothetical protein
MGGPQYIVHEAVIPRVEDALSRHIQLLLKEVNLDRRANRTVKICAQPACDVNSSDAHATSSTVNEK